MKSIRDKMEMQEGVVDAWGDGFSGATDGHMVMAKIVLINAEKRTCDIKTYGSDPLLANSDWTDVQWLSAYGSPEGDEVSFVPRVGALCIVAFVNSIPWIIGFFHPVALDANDEPEDLEGEGIQEGEVAASASANKEKVNAGDVIMRTAGNCRLVLRAGGEIEIESTKVCKRVMFPSKNRITEICRNYEFSTDGGTLDWIDHPDDEEKTISTQVWRDDISSTNIIRDTRGTVDIGSPVIHRFEIREGGPQQPGSGTVNIKPPVILKEVKNTGETLFQINEVSYENEILPDGDFTEGINNYTYFKHVKPTGETQININNNWNLKTLPDGDTTLDIGIPDETPEKQKPKGGKGKLHLNIKPTGETTLDINEKLLLSMKPTGATNLNVGPGNCIITIEPSGETKLDVKGNTITITPGGEININASSKVSIKAPKVSLNGEASGIITANGTHNVVDYITGIPVTPSTTVFGDI